MAVLTVKRPSRQVHGGKERARSGGRISWCAADTRLATIAIRGQRISVVEDPFRYVPSVEQPTASRIAGPDFHRTPASGLDTTTAFHGGLVFNLSRNP